MLKSLCAEQHDPLPVSKLAFRRHAPFEPILVLGDFMLRTIATFVLGLALAASAAAQTSTNPVVEHFRAYRAALAQGDLAAADSAATAALAASEAQDGDGGRTAILALNLASLRLERGDRAGALQPAQRAHELATTRSHANVDTGAARLVLARAESVNGQSREALRATIVELAGNAALATEIFAAASDLGQQDLNEPRIVDATRSAEAFGIAAQAAQTSPGEVNIDRARALIAQARALLYVSARRQRQTLMPSDEQAHALLHEAVDILRPLDVRTPRQPISEGTRLSANALAWHAALNARLGSLDARRPWHDERPLLSVAQNICPHTGAVGPMPAFPFAAERGFRVGAVVIALHVNDEGEIVHRDVIAAAPGRQEFQQGVGRAFDTWQIRWSETAPTGCERAHVMILPITFMR